MAVIAFCKSPNIHDFITVLNRLFALRKVPLFKKYKDLGFFENALDEYIKKIRLICTMNRDTVAFSSGMFHTDTLTGLCL